jgi:hypothetical protein
MKKQAAQNQRDNQRRYPRYHALAAIRIDGYYGQALLKDINLGGFRMQSRTFVSLTPGVKYTINITPESDMNLFSLVVEVRWVKSEISRFEAGFAIIQTPIQTPADKKAFEMYIDYLKSHKKPN